MLDRKQAHIHGLRRLYVLLGHAVSRVRVSMPRTGRQDRGLNGPLDLDLSRIGRDIAK